MIEKLIKEYGDPNDVFAMVGRGKYNKKVARSYLEKYFLPEKDYLKKWKPIENTIFQNQDKSLPEMVFQDHFDLLGFLGGCLFQQKYFETLQACMQALGDQHLVIIHKPILHEDIPPLRMIYPSSITWSEMMSGNYISYIICESSLDDYFVFSESGLWGKYACTDYYDPNDNNMTELNVIGFQPAYNAIFKKHFKPLQEEEMKKRLPPLYKNRCKWYI
ncbi:MAG: hypothetical protein AAF380_02395 [Bacteroidota bacterium]